MQIDYFSILVSAALNIERVKVEEQSRNNRVQKREQSSNISSSNKKMRGPQSQIAAYSILGRGPHLGVAHNNRVPLLVH